LECPRCGRKCETHAKAKALGADSPDRGGGSGVPPPEVNWEEVGFEKDFGGLPAQRPPGYYLREVLRSAREETGVPQATLSHYIATRNWKPSNRSLKTTAKILARALDEYLKGRVAVAMDIVAGRLRALVHVDITGKWAEGEQLQADRSKDVGLASGRDLYYAREQAKLFQVASPDSSGGEPTAPRKKKKKRGKGKKPKKE